jgi:LDH2 family malate/lactate/ureidoglycolate dehydrogenase
VADVPIPELRSAMLARAGGLGFGADAAGLLVDHFLDAELRGAPTHGVERLRWVAGFADLDPSARPRLELRAEGIARWDGDGALGYLALAEALDRELDDPPAGARLVVVSHCFPTGRLGWFAERVARRGLLCVLTATSTARIVHPGGGPAVVGTNPICLGLPGGEPLVVDVSMGRVTYGAVLHASATGARLPDGALRRPDGSPEPDPGAVTADRAGIVPFGGEQAHKGFALAALVELVCGALGGTDGFSAVALIAPPHADPVPGLRAALAGRRMPGDRGRDARAAAVRSGVVPVPDALWGWITDGDG